MPFCDHFMPFHLIWIRYRILVFSSTCANIRADSTKISFDELWNSADQCWCLSCSPKQRWKMSNLWNSTVQRWLSLGLPTGLDYLDWRECNWFSVVSFFEKPPHSRKTLHTLFGSQTNCFQNHWPCIVLPVLVQKNAITGSVWVKMIADSIS